MAEATRFTLSIPAEIVERVDALKKSEFYDKPYSEIYRYLIELGIAAATSVGKGAE